MHLSYSAGVVQQMYTHVLAGPALLPNCSAVAASGANKCGKRMSSKDRGRCEQSVTSLGTIPSNHEGA